MEQTDLAATLDSLVAAINSGDGGAVEGHLADEYFAAQPAPGDPSAREAISEIIRDLMKALPDLEIALSEVVVRDEELTARATFSGTHLGALWGAPPTGNPFRWEAPITVRAVGDRLALKFDVSPPEAGAAFLQLELVNPPDQMDRPLRHPSILPELLFRVMFTGTAGAKPCTHLDQIAVTEPDTDVCRPCVGTGDIWPALRLCLVCGFVGCCEQAKNQHALRHYQETGHPIVRSIRLAEGWIWCYPDAAFFPKRVLEEHQQKA